MYVKNFSYVCTIIKTRNMIAEKLIEIGKEIEANVDRLIELREKGQAILKNMTDVEIEEIIILSEELSELNDRVSLKVKQLI